MNIIVETEYVDSVDDGMGKIPREGTKKKFSIPLSSAQQDSIKQHIKGQLQRRPQRDIGPYHPFLAVKISLVNKDGRVIVSSFEYAVENFPDGITPSEFWEKLLLNEA